MHKEQRNASPATVLRLLVLAIAVMGQSGGECQISQTMMSLIDSKLDNVKGQTQGVVYVCSLSFIDAVSKTAFLSDKAQLIDEAVQDGMQQAEMARPDVKLNQQCPRNTDANVNRLVDIFYDANSTMRERYNRVVRELMEPHGTDILISGQITDAQIIQIKPMGVSKNDQAIKSKDLTYTNKGELFTQIRGQLALTPRAREEIAKVVKDFIIGK